MFFEAEFRLEDGRQIELLVFCDEIGNLAGVDVQCEGNSEPVPPSPEYADRPFRVYASDRILSD